MRKNILRFLDGMQQSDLQRLFVTMLEQMTEEQINAMLWNSLSIAQLETLEAQFAEARQARWPRRNRKEA